MIGFPGEFEEDVFDTIKLNKQIFEIGKENTSCTMCYVAPYAGTVIHNICLDLGLMEENTKPGYKGLAKNISMRKGPIIKNPCMSNERIIEIYNDFSNFLSGKKEIPSKFLKTDPLRKYAEDNEVASAIYEIYARYKNGPKDIDPNDLRKNNSDLMQVISPA
jgi:hypothetical protein